MNRKHFLRNALMCILAPKIITEAARNLAPVPEISKPDWMKNFAMMIPKEPFREYTMLVSKDFMDEWNKAIKATYRQYRFESFEFNHTKFPINKKTLFANE